MLMVCLIYMSKMKAFRFCKIHCNELRLYAKTSSSRFEIKQIDMQHTIFAPRCVKFLSAKPSALASHVGNCIESSFALVCVNP
jgi:hypothetical protein